MYITVRLYDDFIRLLFLHDHREASVLSNELPEESDQFRFLRDTCFANLKGAVGLIMVKVSVMWISIPLDLSSRSFIPLPRFIRLCRPTPLLAPYLVLFPSCSENFEIKEMKKKMRKLSRLFPSDSSPPSRTSKIFWFSQKI